MQWKIYGISFNSCTVTADGLEIPLWTVFFLLFLLCIEIWYPWYVLLGTVIRWTRRRSLDRNIGALSLRFASFLEGTVKGLCFCNQNIRLSTDSSVEYAEHFNLLRILFCLPNTVQQVCMVPQKLASTERFRRGTMS